MEVDPFQFLGIQPGCDFAAITTAHAERCRKYPELQAFFDQALLELIGSPQASVTAEEEKPPAAAPAIPVAAIIEPAPAAEKVRPVEPIVIRTAVELPATAAPGAASYCQMADESQQKGNVQQALDYYNQALAFNPQYAPAYAGRGRLYAGPLRRPDLALADFNHVIVLEAEMADAYYLRGKLYADALGEAKRALADFSQAIALNPALGNAYLERGCVYRGQGELRKRRPIYPGPSS
jgi:tetratricopeptide (TPR) repeat protein